MMKMMKATWPHVSPHCPQHVLTAVRKSSYIRWWLSIQCSWNHGVAWNRVELCNIAFLQPQWADCDRSYEYGNQFLPEDDRKILLLANSHVVAALNNNNRRKNRRKGGGDRVALSSLSWLALYCCCCCDCKQTRKPPSYNNRRKEGRGYKALFPLADSLLSGAARPPIGWESHCVRHIATSSRIWEDMIRAMCHHHHK